MSTRTMLVAIGIAAVLLLLLIAFGLVSAASASERMRRFHDRRERGDRRSVRRSTPDRRRSSRMPVER